MISRTALVVLPWGLLSAQEPAPLVPPEEAARQSELSAARQEEKELDAALKAARARREQLEAPLRRSEDDDVPELEEDQNRIVKGVSTVEFESVGALVKGPDTRTARSSCTGTLVGCRTFLTANHCVEKNRSPANYHVFLQHAGFVDVEWISPQHPSYAFPHADLAVLRLARPVDGLPRSVINKSFDAPAGTAGTIVGFGRTGGSARDSGVKRRGVVKTVACDRAGKSLLCWDFANDPSGAANTCNADSGGPLFVQDPSNPSRSLLAGVTSGGTVEDCLGGDHSYDVDVRQLADWVATQAGADLGATQCGTRPLVGTKPVKLLVGNRQLQIGEAQDFRFQVAEGVSTMVVALNGSDNPPRTNFNLFVRRGARAGVTTNDCAWNDPGNYAACTFDRPAAGEWFVRVDQQGQDTAEFQLVVTQYP